MGQIFARLFNRFGRCSSHQKLLMLGLDGAGHSLFLSPPSIYRTGGISSEKLSPIWFLIDDYGFDVEVMFSDLNNTAIFRRQDYPPSDSHPTEHATTNATHCGLQPRVLELPKPDSHHVGRWGPREDPGSLAPLLRQVSGLDLRCGQ